MTPPASSYVAATGSPTAFLDYYLAERIEKIELFLKEDQAGNVVAGEARLDPRSPGRTRYRVVVGSAIRDGGIGREL